MGHIPNDTSSPRGLTTFNNTPSTQADFNRLRELVEQRGNFEVGTTTQREAVAGNAKYEGHHWYDTTLHALYFMDSSLVWVPAVVERTYGSIAPVVGTTVNGGTQIIRDPDDWVHGYIDLGRPILGTDIAVIQNGFRPLAQVQFSGVASEGGSAGHAFCRIATNGNISALVFPSGDTRLQFTFGYQGQEV